MTEDTKVLDFVINHTSDPDNANIRVMSKIFLSYIAHLKSTSQNITALVNEVKALDTPITRSIATSVPTTGQILMGSTASQGTMEAISFPDSVVVTVASSSTVKSGEIYIDGTTCTITTSFYNTKFKPVIDLTTKPCTVSVLSLNSKTRTEIVFLGGAVVSASTTVFSTGNPPLSFPAGDSLLICNKTRNIEELIRAGSSDTSGATEHGPAYLHDNKTVFFDATHSGDTSTNLILGKSKIGTSWTGSYTPNVTSATITDGQIIVKSGSNWVAKDLSSHVATEFVGVTNSFTGTIYPLAHNPTTDKIQMLTMASPIGSDTAILNSGWTWVRESGNTMKSSFALVPTITDADSQQALHDNSPISKHLLFVDGLWKVSNKADFTIMTSGEGIQNSIFTESVGSNHVFHLSSTINSSHVHGSSTGGRINVEYESGGDFSITCPNISNSSFLFDYDLIIYNTKSDGSITDNTNLIPYSIIFGTTSNSLQAMSFENEDILISMEKTPAKASMRICGSTYFSCSATTGNKFWLSTDNTILSGDIFRYKLTFSIRETF